MSGELAKRESFFTVRLNESFLVALMESVGTQYVIYAVKMREQVVKHSFTDEISTHLSPIK